MLLVNVIKMLQVNVIKMLLVNNVIIILCKRARRTKLRKTDTLF